MEEIKDYDAKIANLESFINEVKDTEEALITVLNKAQDIFGYIPTRVQQFIAEKLNSNPAEVYGVITFYPNFRTKPTGDYTIKICNGTACHLAGAEDVIDEFSKILKIKMGETTNDNKFTLKAGKCENSCAQAVVVSVGEDMYTNVSTKEVRSIIEKYI